LKTKMYATEEPSIYSLLTVEETKEKKPKRYTSRFRDTAKQEYVSGRGNNKTMGPAKVDAPQPNDYLKKHEKEPKLPTKEIFKYPDEERNRPSVPTKDDTPLMGLKTNKNFISNNAVETITSVPKCPAKKFADTRHGDSQDLIPSGMDAVFVHKKEYGEVPSYLVKRKEEVKKAQEEYDQYVLDRFRVGALRKLTEEERDAVLDGLKANWADVHEQYQGLSVVTDTAPKKNRKERMEAQMKQLERDIELIEKHKVIYIGN